MNPGRNLIESDVARQIRDFMKSHGWRSIRTQFAFAPGSFSTGEPGMPDNLFLRYLEPGAALSMWVEMKSPNDRRRCTCRPGKQCKKCRQQAWQERERKRGAVVVQADSIEAFIEEYRRYFNRYEPLMRGQLEFKDMLA